MPKRRKEGNKFTTISVTWEDKTKLRILAKYKKETKNGKLYESDSEVFARLIQAHKDEYNNIDRGTAHSTYPTVLQDKHLQD